MLTNLNARERIRAGTFTAEEFVNGHGKNFRAIEPQTYLTHIRAIGF